MTQRSAYTLLAILLVTCWLIYVNKQNTGIDTYVITKERGLEKQ